MKKKEMQKKSKEQLIHHNETHKLDIHTHCPYCFPHFCQTSPLPPDASKRKKLSPEREEAVEDLVDIIRENQKLKNEGKEEWEREFYGELALNDDTWNYRNNIQITPKEVKDFIRKTVSQARQQERERVINLIKGNWIYMGDTKVVLLDDIQTIEKSLEEVKQG